MGSRSLKGHPTNMTNDDDDIDDGKVKAVLRDWLSK
jgi:hypothetical protein